MGVKRLLLRPKGRHNPGSCRNLSCTEVVGLGLGRARVMEAGQAVAGAGDSAKESLAATAMEMVMVGVNLGMMAVESWQQEAMALLAVATAWEVAGSRSEVAGVAGGSLLAEGAVEGW